MLKTTRLQNFLTPFLLVFISSQIYAQVGIGLTNPTAQLTVNEDAIFNESGADNDFRIESNALANMFFIDASTNRIGINTNSPLYQMHILNNGNIGATSLFQSTNNGTDGVSLTGINFGLANGYNGIEGATYGTYSGVFGLGVSDDNGGSYDANGVYGHANDYQGVGVYGVRSGSGGPNTGFGGLFIANLGYTGAFGAVSDRRLKKDINQLENALDIVLNLNPVSYNFDTDAYPYLGLNPREEFGFIAQELEEILPQIVNDRQLDINATKPKKINAINESQNEIFKMVNYIELIPILTKAFQEQQEIISNQNTKITTLESKLQLLESKLNELLNNQD